MENLKNLELFKKYPNKISTLSLWRISQKMIQEKAPNLLKIQAELIKELEATKTEEIDHLAIINTLT